ncbi:MAG TPA: hypothetical protein VK745_02205 [Polyangiaceae bacterium]|jgi:hypothetical protein|nr:hypothetical protein [Polyangiaceae bacterium]
MIAKREAFLVFAGALLALSSTACTSASSCSRDPDSLTVPLIADGGVEIGPDGGPELSADGGVEIAADGGGQLGGTVDGDTYSSAPNGGPYAYFPAFRTITFVHGLGAIPLVKEFWLAFSAYGTLAPSAGNMTELVAPTNGGPQPVTAETVTVYNDTCSEFYLYTVLQRPSP